MKPINSINGNAMLQKKMTVMNFPQQGALLLALLVNNDKSSSFQQ